MTNWVANGGVLCKGSIQDGLTLAIEGGVVREISGEMSANGGEVFDLEGDLLVPGFVDIQVNGGGGVLFNDAPTVDSIACIAQAHRAFGTTTILPTLISDDLEVVSQGMRAVEDAIEQGVPGIAGIHVEGPFISPTYRGVHDPEKVRTFDDEALEVLSSLRVGKTLVTLAPEIVRPFQVGELIKRGVIVSIGHTGANLDESQTAFAAGATGVTHLFNAMPPLLGRAPGPVGAALLNDNVSKGIIVDGHHVSYETLRLALNASKLDSFMLVSDAMPSVGTAKNRFELCGETIVVENGACRNEHGKLAGAHLTLADAVANCTKHMGVGIADAVSMASAVPAKFLGLDGLIGSIEPGLQADFVRLDPATLAVRGVWVAGRYFEAAT